MGELGSKILSCQEIAQNTLISSVEKTADACKQSDDKNIVVRIHQATKSRFLPFGELLHARASYLGRDADHVAVLLWSYSTFLRMREVKMLFSVGREDDDEMKQSDIVKMH